MCFSIENSSIFFISLWKYNRKTNIYIIVECTFIWSDFSYGFQSILTNNQTFTQFQPEMNVEKSRDTQYIFLCKLFPNKGRENHFGLLRTHIVTSLFNDSIPQIRRLYIKHSVYMRCLENDKNMKISVDFSWHSQPLKIQFKSRVFFVQCVT